VAGADQIPGLPWAEEFPLAVTVGDPDQTRQLGRQVADLLVGGEIILLHGPLGAGKTCFTQGVCAGLDVTDEVVSPTFTLVNTYGGRLKVHHLDFYRVEAGDSLEDIGVPAIVDEVLDGGAVALVEWPAPLLDELGPRQRRLELLALPGRKSSERTWHLRGTPDIPEAWNRLFARPTDGEE